MCYTSVVGDHCKSLDTFLGMLCISDPHMLLGGAPLGVVLCDPHIYLGGAHVGGPTGSAGLPQPGARPMQGLGRQTGPLSSQRPCSCCCPCPCRPLCQLQVSFCGCVLSHTWMQGQMQLARTMWIKHDVMNSKMDAGLNRGGSHNVNQCGCDELTNCATAKTIETGLV